MPTTIERIETIVFRLPLKDPLRWGKASVLDDLVHVLVRVTLSNGAVGVAEAPPRPTIYGETVHSITGIIAQELAPRLLGEQLNAERLSQLYERMAQIKNNHTARGALDMALWDALATHQGASLGQLLGAQASRVPVSYILGIGAEDKVIAEAQRVTAQGVRVLKVKVGRDWRADAARLARLQEILGPDVILYVDANECFDADNAAERLSVLAEMGIRYCEEPLPVELIQERADLCRRQHLPLIADDSAFSVRDLRRELALNTFDVLNIKTARTGYTESTQMLDLARQAHKGIMIGSQAAAGLGTVRAALFAAKDGIQHPSELSFFLKLDADLLTTPLVISDGYLQMSDVLAATLDPQRVRDATLEHAEHLA
ncbi:MAG: enolase C-terminal domain-like protein [Caldilineaceae bacterium]